MSKMEQLRKALTLHVISAGSRALLPALAALGWALQGCGNTPASTALAPSATQCQSNTIQLGIGEGFIQHFCGCTNLSAGTVKIQPTTGFTCTGPVPSASVPTVVVFLYINPVNRHQIQAVTTPANGFTNGPLVDPNNEDLVIRSHALVITASGTYDFRDAFNSTLVGRLTL